jgi:proline iminopeptidase
MTFYKRHFCRTEPWPDYLFESLGKMGHGVFAHMFGKSVFSLTGVIRDCDLTESLKNITVPTLLTSGRHDYTTPAATQYFCDKIPGARMIVFENASHLHHIEQSEEFLRAVREFLKSIE